MAKNPNQFQPFLTISAAVERLQHGMFAQSPRPLPLNEMKKHPSVGRDASIDWSLWKEKAAATIRQAALRGSLPIYFIPATMSECTMAASVDGGPILLPAVALSLVIPSRQGLPDHPTRLAKPAPSNGHFDEWRWKLIGCKLLVETNAFERWYRTEKRKGKWPSQVNRAKRKPGRPRVAEVWAHRIANLIEREKWCAHQPISQLKKLLAELRIVASLSETLPSDCEAVASRDAKSVAARSFPSRT
ncbi:hypothetical protein QM467_18200 [Rhodoblastus sp. 17X3]|uniref:hypothetical protein n=1 Tax=Rhodoblastus sp. 17X3 TaxID=3047026 RepID=UPI0024B6565B|nr:hypothetical protein [Rhodoblastus sp. 17X3]MDI9849975.1 hypothetical protein [Rhodoblastus sp. 17X3]